MIEAHEREAKREQRQAIIDRIRYRAPHDGAIARMLVEEVIQIIESQATSERAGGEDDGK